MTEGVRGTQSRDLIQRGVVILWREVAFDDGALGWGESLLQMLSEIDNAKMPIIFSNEFLSTNGDTQPCHAPKPMVQQGEGIALRKPLRMTWTWSGREQKIQQPRDGQRSLEEFPRHITVVLSGLPNSFSRATSRVKGYREVVDRRHGFSRSTSKEQAVVYFQGFCPIYENDGATANHLREIQPEGVFRGVALEVCLLNLDVANTTPAS